MRWIKVTGCLKPAVILLLAGLLGQFSAKADDAEKKPLRMGLLPYLSTQKLVTTYEPLAEYLEARLGRKVILVTAPGFIEFFHRANRGRYDFYMTAPHFAAFAEARYKHQRLVRLARRLDGTIVVPRTSSVRTLADLRGKVLSTPDKLAVITILAEQLLAQRGLVPGKNIIIRHASSHNNSIRMMLEGLSDAAVSLTALYTRLGPAKKSRLRVLAVTREIPHAMFMSSSQLDFKTCIAIRQAMLDYGKTREGRQFFNKTAFVDFVEITDSDMDSVKGFIPMIERRIK